MSTYDPHDDRVTDGGGLSIRARRAGEIIAARAALEPAPRSAPRSVEVDDAGDDLIGQFPERDVVGERPGADES